MAKAQKFEVRDASKCGKHTTKKERCYMKSERRRFNMSATGSYISIADSLADEGVKHVLKMGYSTRRPDDSDNPNDLEVVFSTDHVLLDFQSLIAEDLDVNKIVADCEFVKEIALKNPVKLKQLVETYTSSPKGFEKAFAIAKEIGLTEEAAIAAGGGMFWIPIILAAVIMARACSDAGNGNPQRKPKPVS
jgi:hypothetical protein